MLVKLIPKPRDFIMSNRQKQVAYDNENPIV